MESGNGTRQDWMYHMPPRGVGFKGGRGDIFLQIVCQEFGGVKCYS